MTPDKNAPPEYYDQSDEYSDTIRDLVSQLTFYCDQANYPLVVAVATAAANVPEEKTTRFTMVGSVVGHLHRMPTEMMLMAALLEPGFAATLASIRPQHLAMSVRDEAVMGDTMETRTAYRASLATVAASNGLEDAQLVIDEEIQSVNRLVALYADQAFLQRALKGGTSLGSV